MCCMLCAKFTMRTIVLCAAETSGEGDWIWAGKDFWTGP